MSDFMNNPSKEELINNLNIVLEIESYKAGGYDVSISNGMVYYTNDDGVKNIIGTLPNLAETTQYLFGDTVPEGVEYITMNGITMMTYYSNLIDCGYMDKGWEEYEYTFNSVIHNDIVGAVGSTADRLVDKPIYGTVSTASASLEMLLRGKDTTLNYDNIIGLLANLWNFTGGTIGFGDVVNGYANAGTRTVEKSITQVALAELEINDGVILEFALKKDDTVTITWAEGNGESDTSVITMDDLMKEDFYDELKKAYPDMRNTLAECLDDADMETLDELFGYYGEASSARVNIDPLVFDMENDGFDMKPLTEGTHFDMDGDGISVNDEVGALSGEKYKKIRPNRKCSSSVMENGMAA